MLSCSSIFGLLCLFDVVLLGGVPGRAVYGLRYVPDSGDYFLSQKSAAGYTITVAGATLFENGSWTSDAVVDSKLFVDGDPNKPTQLAKDLSIDINKKHMLLIKL